MKEARVGRAMQVSGEVEGSFRIWSVAAVVPASSAPSKTRVRAHRGGSRVMCVSGQVSDLRKSTLVVVVYLLHGLSG